MSSSPKCLPVETSGITSPDALRRTGFWRHFKYVITAAVPTAITHTTALRNTRNTSVWWGVAEYGCINKYIYIKWFSDQKDICTKSNTIEWQFPLIGKHVSSQHNLPLGLSN